MVCTTGTEANEENEQLLETLPEADREREIPWLAFLPPSNLFPVILAKQDISQQTWEPRAPGS